MAGKRYLNWLLRIVVPDREMRELYNELFEELFTTEFISIVNNDDNRAYNGLNLRMDYSDSHGGKWDSWLANAPCSLLEVMIGMAISAENMMHDEDKGDRTHEWFWAMMENTGLKKYFGDRFDRKKVQKICKKIINREYGPDGKGGLFRLKGDWGDLREVELWYQMCWWLTENVEF